MSIPDQPAPRTTATCSGCNGVIELVPTPEGANPIWWPVHWRHLDLADLDRPHKAVPAVDLPYTGGAR